MYGQCQNIFVLISDKSDQLQPLVMLQYQFTGAPHVVMKCPHGNSKRTTPYKRTKKSTLDRLKELCQSNLPSQACATIEKEAGGIVNAESSGSIPQRKQQASDICRQLFHKEDEMALLVQQCKLEGTEAFVRCVSLAPEPLVVLATDFQLGELQRCYTSHANSSVLSVDPTFELGNFYVTLVSFLHPMFTSCDTGGNSLFIGPMLIHKKWHFKHTIFCFSTS